MSEKVGENIQREWDEDPFPGELWDGLQALKQDRGAGIAKLTELALRGSTLAMMYLGHAHTSAAARTELESGLGKAWLIKSAEGGSIEGRYQLADHYVRQGDGDSAVSELKNLAEQGYAPAMYRLGGILYRGELVDRDVPGAVHYLEMAKQAGHLPAMGFLSWIYRKEDFGIAGRLASHWNCLVKIPVGFWYIFRYPNSDRMRGFPFPSRSTNQSGSD